MRRSSSKPISPEDFASLSETERRDVETRQQELSIEMERVARNQQEIMREMEQDIQLIERHFCESLLIPIIKRMEEKLKNEEANAYLAEVKAHVLDNLDDFKEVPPASMPPPFMPAPIEADVAQRSHRDGNLRVVCNLLCFGIETGTR